MKMNKTKNKYPHVILIHLVSIIKNTKKYTNLKELIIIVIEGLTIHFIDQLCHTYE